MAASSSICVLVFLVLLQVCVGYKVVCYYVNWSHYGEERMMYRGVEKMMPVDIDPYLCTHILFAFAKIETGELAPTENTDYALYRQTTDLKMRNPSLKVLLSVGGWAMGSMNFSTTVASLSTRSHFITTSIAYLRRFGFDGLDIDWEYPAARGSPATDKENFALLCEELKVAFEVESEEVSKPRLLLTIAAPHGDGAVNHGYDIKRLAIALDFINLMCYDFHGQSDNFTGLNSPLGPISDEGTTMYAAQYWRSQGMPLDKIVVGVPAYGQFWTIVGASPTPPPNTPAMWAGTIGYLDICSNQAYLNNTVMDPVAQVPYTYVDPRWISYDNAESFLTKCNFIKKTGYGGAMIWDLSLDDFNGQSCKMGKYPLSATISDCLKTDTIEPMTKGDHDDKCSGALSCTAAIRIVRGIFKFLRNYLFK